MKMEVTLREFEGKQTQKLNVEITDTLLIITNPENDFTVFVGNEENQLVLSVLDGEEEIVATHSLVPEIV